MQYEHEFPRIPLSTYRLQFNRFLTFTDAREIISYLNELGITDVYSSPYLKAKPGSLHGYDIIDYEQLNPEVGTEEEFNAFTEELRRFGMGQVSDIVPNHMCILGDNKWWKDVLENGRSSSYAYYFDIDWNYMKESLKEKVLLPILGQPYGKALESGELKLEMKEGAFYLRYFEQELPVEPGSYDMVLKKGIGDLEEKIAGTGEFQELMSILTALSHLPPTDVALPEEIRERHREKEVIKRRLRELYESSLTIRKFIDSNIALFQGTRGEPRSFDPLDELLSSGPYRLSLWKVAAEEINYRRFFDINELAAIRVEVPDVFVKSHKLILKFVRSGKITGLRVDHPDGLYNPSEYLKKLQEECAISAGAPPDEVPMRHFLEAEVEKGAGKDLPFYILGEKILIKGEKLPEDWPIFGTTGYVYMNVLNGIFIQSENAKLIDDVYSRFIKQKLDFQELLYSKKKLIMESSMSGEINVLGYKLGTLAEKSRLTRDYTFFGLTKGLIEVIACFPVYRTYINSLEVSERDMRYIDLAVRKAQRTSTSISSSIFEFIRSVLLLEFPEGLGLKDRAEWLDFVMRFQQQTGPVMAKGLEDTAFYDYNRLLSLNEVGGAPERFGHSLETFHAQNMERAKDWPYAMISTSTHDAKRSEDTRARLNVLTEMPSKWKDAVFRWSKMNKPKKMILDGKSIPDPNEEYHLYQTLLGIWPFEGSIDQAWIERIKEYKIKALRESKVNTSWINTNTEYERAVLRFIEELLKPESAFYGDFDPFARMISYYGMLNALSQVHLKITSPGVPDFYQGTDLWFLSLVDPDNRRKTDYGLRKKILSDLKENEAILGNSVLCQKLLESLPDGRIKLYITWKALNFRKAHKELFLAGEYIPMEVEGRRKENVCAFMKTGQGKSFVSAAPRFFANLIKPGELPLGEKVWEDTRVLLREHGNYHNVYVEKEVMSAGKNGNRWLYLKDMFAGFPLFLGLEIK